MSRKNRPQGLPLRLLDFFILFLAAGITVLCAVNVYGKSSSALRFIIQGKNESWVYPVNQTARTKIAGPLGDTIVELKDGRVYIVSSPCANKSCISSGAIYRKGQWLACLPNGIFVWVEASDGNKKEYAEIDSAVW